MQVRYDEEKGIYRDCKFCRGRGCLACPGEADKAYREAFPNGPQPIATFKMDDPADMARLKKVFGREAIEHAFGPDGRGMSEIMTNLNQSPEPTPEQGVYWAPEI